jgi:hypothetical protein
MNAKTRAHTKSESGICAGPVRQEKRVMAYFAPTCCRALSDDKSSPCIVDEAIPAETCAWLIKSSNSKEYISFALFASPWPFLCARGTWNEPQALVTRTWEMRPTSGWEKKRVRTQPGFSPRIRRPSIDARVLFCFPFPPGYARVAELSEGLHSSVTARAAELGRRHRNS